MLPFSMASQSVEILTGHAVWSLLEFVVGQFQLQAKAILPSKQMPAHACSLEPAGICCCSASVPSKGNSSIEADMIMIIDGYNS